MSEPAALITALILDRPACLDCIGTHAGLDAADVEASLARIETVLVLQRAPDRSRLCGSIATVLSVERPKTGS